ncbi:MAG: metallophosphoesterase [Casimicrobium sp.]
MFRLDRRSLLLHFVIWSPFAAVAMFLGAMRWLPRESKLEAYRFFFTEIFWLVIPYLLLALVCVFWSMRARKWFDASAALAALIVASLAGYGRFIEPNQLDVQETTIEIGSSARIALISDLHVGLFQGGERAQQVVDVLNKLDVDVVLVAGDWTYEPNTPIAGLLAPFSKCRHRVLSVPGNHDEQMPGPPLATELKAALIQNRIVPIEGAIDRVRDIQIIGMGDRWAQKDSIPRMLDTSLPTIALAHNPDSVDKLKNTDVKLLFAGHTHGGQVNIPVLVDWALRGATEGNFKQGLYRRGRQQVYVSSGLGMIGIPLRLFQPPVIDVINLR